MAKNDTLVSYPVDNLDLDQYISAPSSQKSLYTLYSVINHDGSLTDGHYTVFCRDTMSTEQQWFECDDEQIKSLPLERLHSNSKAYLLFYTVK